MRLRWWKRRKIQRSGGGEVYEENMEEVVITNRPNLYRQLHLSSLSSL